MNTTTMTTTDAAVANALHAMGYNLFDYEIEEQDGVRSITIKVASGDDDDAWMDELNSALPKGAQASWDGNSNTDNYGETTEDVTIAWRVMDDHHEE
jgi:hypothetical protein